MILRELSSCYKQLENQTKYLKQLFQTLDQQSVWNYGP